MNTIIAMHHSEKYENELGEYLPALYLRFDKACEELRSIANNLEFAEFLNAHPAKNYTNIETMIFDFEYAIALLALYTDNAAAIDDVPDGILNNIADAKREARFGCGL